MANHYTKEDLELYRNHQMSILGRLTCQAHLKECSDCAQLLKELSEDDDFIRQLRASAQIYEAIVNNEPASKSTHHSI
jgi:hypothetical protein